MSSNPGLREISHSITGGSIGAQGMTCDGRLYLDRSLTHISGYWMPFEAAKAVAATFCYEIRYVLIPIFGKDFPAMCIEPADPAFLRTSIDPSIIVDCRREADAVRIDSRATSTAASTPTPTTLKTGTSWTPKSIRPKTRDTESGYGTDSDRSPFGSPKTNGDHPWSPVNIPRSAAVWGQYAFRSDPDTQLATQKKQDLARRTLLKSQEAGEGRVSPEDSLTDMPIMQKRRKLYKHETSWSSKEILAAKALMQLRKADAALAQKRRSVPRRLTN